MPDEAPLSSKSRDAGRSREAILNAAEDLFAKLGYDAVSLQMIGDRAGASRGIPGYFFGSKESLYNAVLQRILTAELAFVAATAESGSSGDIAQNLDAVIGGFQEFLAARPTFAQLLDREALAGGAILRSTPAHAQSHTLANAISESLLDPAQTRPVDPAAFILAVVALCWFPFSHADTFARPLGIDMANPDDRARWRKSLVEIFLMGIQTAPQPSSQSR